MGETGRQYDTLDGHRVPRVMAMPIGDLLDLVRDIQELLWLRDDETWDAGKQLDSDTLGLICEVMGNYGLAPEPVDD